MANWILGTKFNTVYPHKGSIKTLWESRWKFVCQKSVYPFHDGCYEDFEPIFQKLISDDINDAESDDYTTSFFPTASSLERLAIQALDAGQREKVSKLLCRAAAVYRISRFPYVDVTQPSSLKRTAFELQKGVYQKAISLWDLPMRETILTHTHRSGNDGCQFPIYVRLPDTAENAGPVPVILIMTGLDGYRTDNSQRSHEITARGWATVIMEIPGTADCPADPADPESPDRLCNSVLEFIMTHSRLDAGRVVVWGLSAGGFYAIRAAHTHADRLFGVIAHGPGCHFFLDKEWLSRVDDHEYPFTITTAWAIKHGYKDVEEFKEHAQKKFSLVETGIVHKPSCRMLLLNGVADGVTPIEDCLELFNYGTSKEGRFFPGLPHMGYPDSLMVAYKWLDDLLGNVAPTYNDKPTQVKKLPN
ncbi:hypothetical protein ASPVEDRAFT_652310 [Aspergillus versicolor CBS 583.65]|uniref:Peptidase S9 prolyl oligopeptidase catalytic domain-containing protein n=1 Tax=Aspergillus versicolor CBS 583.65 TaxID=1036611 RepID=A0A1L9PK12_ASPVE|nr:uncharacterized protein ASPVEDRAFT_652310 [Aspergillus versicolor CBS 583.65]OJJ01842.1 hypothetical protein ASPVEDRAFT_652310 [Aspergillus versicolor CBS 583.65]